MLTIEKLKAYGADVEDGLARCMGMEDFYLQMTEMGLKDERFETLGKVLEENRIDEAFEMAHALKGVVGNLALTPIYGPISELTEALRHKTGVDYQALYRQAKAEKDRLDDVLANE